MDTNAANAAKVAPRRGKRLIWIGVVLLTLIGLAVAVRRAAVLTSPPSAIQSANPASALNTGFEHHRTLTFAHIIPASVYLLLLPLQFISKIRSAFPRWHRWNGRLLILLGCWVAATALIMSFTMAIGGLNETAATTLYALLLLLFLALGFIAARKRRISAHREWMMRAYGVTLGIATTRPIVGAFFAARRLTPHEFFGIAFWLGFTLSLLAAEGWLIRTRNFQVAR